MKIQLNNVLEDENGLEIGLICNDGDVEHVCRRETSRGAREYSVGTTNDHEQWENGQCFYNEGDFIVKTATKTQITLKAV